MPREQQAMNGRTDKRIDGWSSAGHSTQLSCLVQTCTSARVSVWAGSSLFAFSTMILCSRHLPRLLEVSLKELSSSSVGRTAESSSSPKRFWNGGSPGLHSEATPAHFENSRLHSIIKSFIHKYLLSPSHMLRTIPETKQETRQTWSLPSWSI